MKNTICCTNIVIQLTLKHSTQILSCLKYCLNYEIRATAFVHIFIMFKTHRSHETVTSCWNVYSNDNANCFARHLNDTIKLFICKYSKLHLNDPMLFYAIKNG